ncbi:hypothetical protein M885DRAFT_470872, partial [Pelagophyceae sp. CCMP2097]
MLFGAAAHLRATKAVKSSTPVETYLGTKAVTRVHVLYTFETFKQWAEFIGILAPGTGFDSTSAQWGVLVTAQLTPLALTRALNEAPRLQNDVLRAAAEDAVDVKLFVLDAIVHVAERFFFVCVRSGYVRGQEPECRQLFGASILGHFGWVPGALLKWNVKGARLITASFTQTTFDGGIPLRGDVVASIKYRPTSVVALSGLI